MLWCEKSTEKLIVISSFNYSTIILKMKVNLYNFIKIYTFTMYYEYYLYNLYIWDN